LPDTYHLAGHGRGTATFKFHEGRDILLYERFGLTEGEASYIEVISAK
jgi:hypothetical protein